MADLVIPGTAVHRGQYSNPARHSLAGIAVIAVFVALLAAWGVLAPLSGAAIAEGSLQVEGRRQTVQHPYGGIVRDLMVREGDKVQKGQVLLTLSDSDPRAKLDVIESERTALLAEEARLIAERDHGTEPNFQAFSGRQEEESVAQTIANERAIMAARQRQYDAQTSVLRQRAAQFDEQTVGLRAEVTGLERQSELLEEEAKGARALLEKGFTPKTRVLALQRDAARLEAERGARLAEISRAREAKAETELEIAKAERTRLTEITDRLRAVQAGLIELKPRLDAASDVLRRTQVTATATGAVVGLAVFTEGGVIQQGARILDIVPSGNPLVVEARLHLTDINDVTPGREADVRLVSINRNERPEISGVVETVSADRLTDDRTGEGYYSILVRMNADDVRAAKIDLQPGMAAEVVVPTRSRTFIEYLISPLLDEITGAFREK